ncbi:MAG TPA: HBL/NHE enterotoxin family protein [Candidatus Sulfotelmatobacter sp.]|nr:HBL/NHE enterotoxin family protein [Candidatus Sulfotelmatobacter sp.]
MANSLRPADLGDHQQVLADHLGAVLMIRGYAVAVEQTNLTSPTDPPPTWYPDLVKNIGTAKTHVGVWTDTLEPAITSQVPQTAISFGTKFKTATDGILSILNASNNSPSEQQKSQIEQELAWLAGHIDDVHSPLPGLSQQFTTFQKTAAADLTTLTTGASSIQDVITADTTVKDRIEGEMADTQSKIMKDKAAMEAAGIAGGVGLFVGVGIMATTGAETFGIGAAIGAFIMVGSLVEAATVLAVYGKDLADQQAKFNEESAGDQKEIEQITALGLLKNTIDGLAGKNEAMAQSLVEIADWWSMIGQKLGAVIQDVKDAAADEADGFWMGLANDITDAQKDWASYVSFATNMQEIASGAQVQTVDTRKVAA